MASKRELSAALALVCASALVTCCLVAAPVRAEVTEIKITKQPGALYVPVVLMEHHRILEKHAALAGLKDFNVDWPKSWKDYFFPLIHDREGS